MKIYFLLFVLIFQLQAKAKDLVLLVPGFFNSFAPEYFSEDVIQSFTQKGFTVYLATGLNPIGTIEDNGARLESIFDQIIAKEGKSAQFNVVAHSAGGFYTMWVAHRQKFNIKNILTVSTPYKGVKFVQAWLNKSYLFEALTQLAHLDGLVQLTPAGVKKFISTVRINPNTRIFAFGGYQNESLDITDAKSISWPLRITSHYISEKSDGIVGFSSAMGVGEIKTTDNKPAIQQNDSKFFVDLEHWEQVLNYKSFVFLGIRNPQYIKNEQTRFYNGLATFLLSKTKTAN